MTKNTQNFQITEIPLEALKMSKDYNQIERWKKALLYESSFIKLEFDSITWLKKHNIIFMNSLFFFLKKLLLFLFSSIFVFDIFNSYHATIFFFSFDSFVC
jgi:hypothetical protein